MDWKLLTREDYVTTSWSGGTTTQLAIAPEGAVYADRDFLWRLSSATVELDHSDFTPLPDYNRFLAVLEGEIKLKIDAQEPFPLAPGRVVAFDGGVPVESWGQCVDFNLMVRKGKAQGAVWWSCAGRRTLRRPSPPERGTGALPSTVCPEAPVCLGLDWRSSRGRPCCVWRDRMSRSPSRERQAS